MKKIAMTAIAAALAFSAPVFADDAPQSGRTAEAKGATDQMPMQLKKMQDNVRMMQPQLDRIGKAKTDPERQKAMAEYMQTMQENMDMARGMYAGMMAGCPMMAGGMMGKGGMGMMGGGQGMMGQGMQGQGMAGADAMMAKRLEMMEKRMDMMQMMMQGQMGMPEGGPAKPAK